MFAGEHGVAVAVNVPTAGGGERERRISGAHRLVCECFEQLGELRAFGGVGGAESLSCAAFDAPADPLDDGATAAREVDENPSSVDGISAAVRQLRGDEPVDDPGGRWCGERSVRGDLTHAAATASGQHQQYAPAVAADTLRRGDRRQRGGYRAVQPIQQLDQTCHTRRRGIDTPTPRRRST
jgi:hypothetical protein